MIGRLTPPVGMVRYVMMSLANVSATAFTRECAVFLAALVGVRFLIAHVPGLRPPAS